MALRLSGAQSPTMLLAQPDQIMPGAMRASTARNVE
jgi:hypothetical protein